MDNDLTRKFDEEGEKDINDVFDEIILTEERLIQEGYEQGYQKGASEENIEGFHLGYHRGAEIGAEIGYYQGVTESYLEYFKNSELSSEQTEKYQKTLNELNSLLLSFPRENKEDIDIWGVMNTIRAKFKKLCAQLKVDLAFPETDKLSF